MSEQTETSLESTQPNKPAPKKKFRINWRGFLLGALALIVLVGLGGLGGYQQAIGDRVDAQSSVVTQQLTEQYALALMDIDAGRYGAAQQRLEFIIQNNPSFPQASQKLAEVMVMAAIPTAAAPPTITPTPDLSGVEEIFQRAQQYINILDWPHAIENLDTLRRKDLTYRTAEVDGMYYFSLHNYGYDLIIKQGNLEGGIYQLTLAERFGPLDSTTKGLRDGARLYILGASFWDLDWKNAVFYFTQLYTGWPQLWDGTMTASERFRIASMRYGDELFAQEQWCQASEQYQNAQKVGNLDAQAEKNAYQAYNRCNPPTPIPIFPTETETPVIPPTP
jgi:tetratricopeptide (TPR) repeat protein